MHQHETSQSDFGTGQKKLGIYIIGTILCSILILIAFGVVMKTALPKWQTFTIIYSAAIIQLFVQVICFLRLNTKTEQGKLNVMSILFTFVILFVIVLGSIWIMWNISYNVM